MVNFVRCRVLKLILLRSSQYCRCWYYKQWEVIVNGIQYWQITRFGHPKQNSERELLLPHHRGFGNRILNSHVFTHSPYREEQKEKKPNNWKNNKSLWITGPTISAGIAKNWEPRYIFLGVGHRLSRELQFSCFAMKKPSSLHLCCYEREPRWV